MPDLMDLDLAEAELDLPPVVIEGGQVHESTRQVWVFGAESVFPDFDGPAIVDFGFQIFFLEAAGLGQVVECDGHAMSMRRKSPRDGVCRG